MFKHSHSVSFKAIGLQLVEGQYNSNAKTTAVHQSRWPNLFPNILFSNSRRIIAHTFPRTSALSCSQSMSREESKEQCADTLPNIDGRCSSTKTFKISLMLTNHLQLTRMVNFWKTRQPKKSIHLLLVLV